jgi:hypothetical protein
MPCNCTAKCNLTVAKAENIGGRREKFRAVQRAVPAPTTPQIENGCTQGSLRAPMFVALSKGDNIH